MLCQPLQADEQATATKVVDTFHAHLLAAMQLESQAERENSLTSVIEASFDFERIAAISLGRTWRSLDEDQRQEFMRLLTELVIATYADRFDGYSGQQFVTVSTSPVKNGYVVQTKITRPREDPVQLDYFLRDGRIFNVVADGVSDLSLRRADYNSIIKKDGYAALLEHMGEKVTVSRSP